MSKKTTKRSTSKTKQIRDLPVTAKDARQVKGGATSTIKFGGVDGESTDKTHKDREVARPRRAIGSH
jgi:hypothetical protein